MPVNFFDPQQQQGPQQMAMQLMLKQGIQPSQGQNVGGQYVPPQTSQYALQLASALAGGQGMAQKRDGMRAQDLLNGGTGEAYQSNLSKLSNLFSGWGGGGA